MPWYAPWLLITSGAVMVGSVLYRRLKPRILSREVIHYSPTDNWGTPLIETVHPPEPPPPSAKYAWYVAAICCFLVPLPLLFPPDLIRAGIYALFAWGGVQLFKQGMKADDTHADNMEARRRAEENHTGLQAARIRTANIVKETERQARLQAYRDEVERQRLETERRAAIQAQWNVDHLEQFRPEASKLGVTIDGYVQGNATRLSNQQEAEHKRTLNQVDGEAKKEEIKTELDAADRIEHPDTQQILELRKEIRETLRLRYAVEASDDPQELKDRLIAGYEEDVKHLQDRINDIKNRSSAPTNGQKAGGNKSGAANSRAAYPPPNGDDENEA